MMNSRFPAYLFDEVNIGNLPTYNDQDQPYYSHDTVGRSYNLTLLWQCVSTSTGEGEAPEQSGNLGLRLAWSTMDLTGNSVYFPGPAFVLPISDGDVHYTVFTGPVPTEMDNPTSINIFFYVGLLQVAEDTTVLLSPVEDPTQRAWYANTEFKIVE